MRDAVVVEEDAVAVTAAVFLQWQRDQIAESTVWQGVLIREEPVVRIETEVRPTFHRLGQNVAAKLSRECGRHSLVEE